MLMVLRDEIVDPLNDDMDGGNNGMRGIKDHDYPDPGMRPLVKILLAVLFLVVALIVIAPHVAAPLLEKVIMEKAGTISGAGRVTLHVETVGLSGIGIGDIKIGDNISIDSIFCSYSPFSLMRKSVERISVSGVDIRLSANGDESHPSTPPPYPEKKSGKTEAKQQSGVAGSAEDEEGDDIAGAVAAFLHYMPPVVDIGHSSLTVTEKERNFTIPFSVAARMDRQNSSCRFLMTLLPFGQKMKVSIEADTASLQQQEGGSVNPRLENILQSVVVSGDNISLSSLNGLISSYMPESDFTLKGKSDIMLAGGGNLSKWKFSVSHIGLSAPFEGEINNVDLAISSPGLSLLSASGSKKSAGMTEYTIKPSDDASKDITGKDVPEKDVQGKDVQKKDAAQKNTSGSNMEDKSIPDKEMTEKDIDDSEPLLTVSGSLWLGIRMISPLNVNLEGSLADGWDWSLSAKGREMWPRKDFMVGEGESAAKIAAPDLFFEMRGSSGFGEGTLKVNMAEVKIKKRPFSMQDLSLVVPIMFGQPDNEVKSRKNGGSDDGTSESTVSAGAGAELKGSFNIGSFRYMDGKFGSLKSDLFIQKSDGVSGGRGETISGIRADGTVSLEGITSFPIRAGITFPEESGLKAYCTYHIKPVVLTPENTGRFLSVFTENRSTVPSGVDFGLTISSTGELAFDGSELDSSVNLDLTDGHISIPGKKIDIKGASTSLQFNELPSIRSAPGEILSIKSLNMKNISLSNGEITYTLEYAKEPDSLAGTSDYAPAFLLEKGSFNWCGGKVLSGAMRFSQLKKSYNLNLFCDRLRLASVLQQLGSFEAEGDGTLNGRIPVTISGGNINFDNGFLYSTPGQGGTIKVLGTERLTAGIPVDTPQFAQVDLAREALKNYVYEWAKLGFNTEGDQLLVKMEFDGRPENVLPFEYRKDIGSFVRVSGRSAGSRFQGIKIDVNLQLPFNRVLKFGNEMNNLFQ